jgi:hypothetical protein
MFWSIHVLNADTLVFRPPTPQSIKANTKPLIISFQPNIPCLETITPGEAVDSNYGPNPWRRLDDYWAAEVTL